MRQYAFYKEPKLFKICATVQSMGRGGGGPIERVTQEPELSESVPAWTRFQQ